jgi:3-phenylpropionate/trans-cinnamate dioxygenase ferredoxin reductase subunit
MKVLVVGAGQAGASLAIALRQGGFDGAITVAGAEPDLPYERPPLSKEYLAGERAPERLLLRPSAFWAERAVGFRLSTRIAAIDASAHTATTGTGEVLHWDRLVWAAGGEARRLPVPGADLPGVHVIRTRADVDRLRTELGAGAPVVIAGGGYIGLEAAAVLTKLGHPVTVVEALPRLLARVAGPEVSAFYLAEHRARGTDIRLGTRIEAIEGDGQVESVRLPGGERLPARAVIAGIGLVPSVEPLRAAGADCPNGVRVDAHARTSLPHVYAVGDCALHPNPFVEAEVRLESVQNASDMAKAAAAHILHGDDAPPYHAVPWFWSNQHDLRLQTVGLAHECDETVVRGAPESRSWSLVYLRAGKVAALDCINAPRDYVQGRALVERGARIAPRLLADAKVPLKSMEG